MNDIYTDLDKLDQLQDELLALAVYDWNFFNDARVYRLRDDYQVNNKMSEIFTYYYGNNNISIQASHERYTRRYREFLQNII